MKPVRLILASTSPRRRDLLAGAGLRLETAAPDVEERPLPGEAPGALAERLARDKAIRVAVAHPDALVLGSDTVVALDGRLLGKPADAQDAVAMLRDLSGHRHQVITGVSFQGPGIDHTFSTRTDVVFRNLSAAEIQAYVGTGEPLDKAGAYGIQGGAAAFVLELHGSYTNVVGLPLAQTLEALGRLAPHLASPNSST